PQLSLFLDRDATDTHVRDLRQRLQAHTGISGFRFVPRAQALDALKSRAGLADVIAGLNGNPLPDAFVITAAGSNAAALETLRAEFLRWPRVAEVHVDSDWARRLDSLLAL